MEGNAVSCFTANVEDMKNQKQIDDSDAMMKGMAEEGLEAADIRQRSKILVLSMSCTSASLFNPFLLTNRRTSSTHTGFPPMGKDDSLPSSARMWACE